MRPDVGEPAPTQQPGRHAMSVGASGRAGSGHQAPPAQSCRRFRPLAAANKARLAEIGLVQTVQAIASAQTEQTRARRAAKAATRAARKAAGAASTGRVRRCAVHCVCCGCSQGAGECAAAAHRARPRLAAASRGGDCWRGSAAVGRWAGPATTAPCTIRPTPCLGCRSERVAGLDAPNYNENERLLSLADPEGRGGRDRRLMRGACFCRAAAHRRSWLRWRAA